MVKPDYMDGLHIPYLSAAVFNGEEAVDFLQSQLTADIAALQAGDGTFACYCTPRGQVLGLWWVQRVTDGLRIAASAELLPAMLKRLQMFVFRTKVSFREAPELTVVGRPGPRYAFREARADDEKAGNAWKAEELENGICWLSAGSSEKFIPQMLGFDEIGAVSFSKGCYPGQEIVARAKYLGQVKRKPVKLQIKNAPDLAAGSKLMLVRDGVETGAVVVDSAAGGEGRKIVFCVAREQQEAALESVRIDGEDYRSATI